MIRPLSTFCMVFSRHVNLRSGAKPCASFHEERFSWEMFTNEYAKCSCFIQGKSAQYFKNCKFNLTQWICSSNVNSIFVVHVFYNCHYIIFLLATDFSHVIIGMVLIILLHLLQQKFANKTNVARTCTFPPVGWFSPWHCLLMKRPSRRISVGTGLEADCKTQQWHY